MAEEKTVEFPPTMKHMRPIIPTANVYGGDLPIGKILDTASAVVATKKRYFNGSNPLVKTSAQEAGKTFEKSSNLTPAQEKYMRGRSNLINASETITVDQVKSVLDLREEELKDAIKRAPLGEAKDRGGNTLGNLLKLTTMAKEQLNTNVGGEKEVLRKVLATVVTEQGDENAFIIRNNSKKGMTYDRDGVINGYTTGEPDMSQHAVATMNANFERGKKNIDEFLKKI